MAGPGPYTILLVRLTFKTSPFFNTVGSDRAKLARSRMLQFTDRIGATSASAEALILTPAATGMAKCALELPSACGSPCSFYGDGAGSQDKHAKGVLAGLVERVTFHNAENGFCVLRIKARGQRDLITVLGHAATISAGEFVQASGGWINDRTHGVQFKASFLKAAPPTTIEGIEKYLGSGTIRGVGPVYAKKLVRAFGAAVFDIIQQEPDRLREVTGIGPRRAERIIAGWESRG